MNQNQEQPRKSTLKHDLLLLVGALVGMALGAGIGWIVGASTGDKGIALYVAIPLGIIVGLAVASKIRIKRIKIDRG